MQFSLTPKEEKRFLKWQRKLPKVKKKAISNSCVWIKFIMTGIGTVVKIGRSDIPKHDKNITDYDCW